MRKVASVFSSEFYVREIMDETPFELNFRNEPNFNTHHKVSEHLKFTFQDEMKLK